MKIKDLIQSLEKIDPEMDIVFFDPMWRNGEKGTAYKLAGEIQALATPTRLVKVGKSYLDDPSNHKENEKTLKTEKKYLVF